MDFLGGACRDSFHYEPPVDNRDLDCGSLDGSVSCWSVQWREHCAKKKLANTYGFPMDFVGAVCGDWFEVNLTLIIVIPIRAASVDQYLAGRFNREKIVRNIYQIHMIMEGFRRRCRSRPVSL